MTEKRRNVGSAIRFSGAYRRQVSRVWRARPRDPKYAWWICENPGVSGSENAQARIPARRGALEIESLGGIVADKLVESGLIRTIPSTCTTSRKSSLPCSTWERPRNRGSSGRNTPQRSSRGGNGRAHFRLPAGSSRWRFRRWVRRPPTIWRNSTAPSRRSRESPLLRDVVELERLRAEVDATKPGRGKKTGEPELLLGDDSAAVRHSAAQAALEQTVERLRKAGFGQVTRKKDGSGFVTKAGPVLARAVLDYFHQTGERPC